MIALLQPLVDKKIDNKKKLAAEWRKNPKCALPALASKRDADFIGFHPSHRAVVLLPRTVLLRPLAEWLDAEHHQSLASIWPPLETEAPAK